MKLFQCQNCDAVVYFENTQCLRCGSQLGFLPDRLELSAVSADGPLWIAMADPDARYRFCANWTEYACNWMLPATDHSEFCLACRHNRTIPNLDDPENRRHWQRIEEAKRRLFYSLISLGLPTPAADSGDPQPLEFDFLADPPDGPRVLTGHDNGLITIALAEADDPVREAARVSMGELYRTLLGHFRHEVGHYYWDRLIRDGGELDSFRALFGDDRADYGEALHHHYRDGAPANWSEHYVSAYASMHPWEDWAETWAHYLHIIDTLEMAGAFGIRIAPAIATEPSMRTAIQGEPRLDLDFARLIDAWLPLTYAINNLNRVMGLPDFYPFVIAPPVIAKMEYIHGVVQRAAGR